jgi:hypothetical protein
MSESELQPDTAEVLQAEAPEKLTAVPVCVEEVRAPVRAQQLPRKGGSTQTRTVSTAAKRYLLADHWRGSVTIMSMDQNIMVGFSEAAAQDPEGAMSIWPKLVPLVVTATVEIWLASVAATTDVSLTAERWAEG